MQILPVMLFGIFSGDADTVDGAPDGLKHLIGIVTGPVDHILQDAFIRLLGAVDINIRGFFAGFGKNQDFIVVYFGESSSGGECDFVTVFLANPDFSNGHRGNQRGVAVQNFKIPEYAGYESRQDVVLVKDSFRRYDFNLK